MYKATSSIIIPLLALFLATAVPTAVSSTKSQDACIGLINAQAAALGASDWQQLKRLAQTYIEDCQDVHGAEVLAAAHGNRGNAYIEVGDTESALASANRCVELHYASIHCHITRIQAQVRLHRIEEARSSYSVTKRLVENRKKELVRDLGRTNPRRHRKLNAAELESIHAAESYLQRLQSQLFN